MSASNKAPRSSIRNERDTSSSTSLEIHSSSDVPQILCVDDDPEVSRLIAMRLGEFDVDVTSAFFGMHGFWGATTDRPDLIIMDLAMPNGDGEFVLQSIRANRETQGIPVIILTGMRDRRYGEG